MVIQVIHADILEGRSVAVKKNLIRVAKCSVFLLFGWAAICFVIIQFSGITDSSFWMLALAAYVAMLLINAACLVLRPGEKAKYFEWLTWRIIVPPAFAFSRELGTLVGATSISIVFEILVWASIALFAGLAVLEVILRIVTSFVAEVSNGDRNILDIIMSWMDKLWLQEIPQWIPAEDTLEKVIIRHPAYTIESVVRKFTWVFKVTSFVFFVVLIFAVLWTFWLVFGPFFHDLQAPLNLSFLSFWPLLAAFVVSPAIGFVIGVVPLLYTFLIAEWNRRSYGAVIYRNLIYIVWCIAPIGTSGLSIGATAALTEPRIGSPGEGRPREEPEEERGFWEGLWDGFLKNWSGWGVGSWYLPVPTYGGADLIDFVGDVYNQMSDLRQISQWSIDLGMIRRTGYTVLVDPEKARTAGWLDDKRDPYTEAAELRQLYLRRIAELTETDLEDLIQVEEVGGEIVDLMQVLREGDPGRWVDGRPTFEVRRY